MSPPRTGPYPRPRYGQYRGATQQTSENAPRPGRHSAPDRDGQGRPDAAGRSGQLIRQRDAAVPELANTGPIAAIAPDDLAAFARDLRALRAKAELDYPDMAERSHYTMKTLASAAGGLRLPTLPVAVAYVRACGGDEAEWEERWHKLAEKLSADKTSNDSEELPAEPADTSDEADPAAQQDKPADSGEVYVITSAKPREPGW
jgi:hypothetical protein